MFNPFATEFTTADYISKNEEMDRIIETTYNFRMMNSLNYGRMLDLAWMYVLERMYFHLKKGDWSGNALRNCFWYRYWGHAGQLLANFFPLLEFSTKFSRLSFLLDSKVPSILKTSLRRTELYIYCRCFSGFASVGVYGGSDCLQAVNLPSTVSQSINSCTRAADRKHHRRIC